MRAANSLYRRSRDQCSWTRSFDVKDFPDIARRWAEAGRSHSGLAIVVGIDHGELGPMLRALESLLEGRPAEDDWRNYTCFASRSEAGIPVL